MTCNHSLLNTMKKDEKQTSNKDHKKRESLTSKHAAWVVKIYEVKVNSLGTCAVEQITVFLILPLTNIRLNIFCIQE